MQRKAKYYSKEEALQKLRHYCAYQERCQKEVRTKLLELGQRGDDLEEIIAMLIEENFIDEERFAQLYVGGKFRIKRWGRQKIINGLMQKNISDYCMNKAIKMINEEDYFNVLKELATSKLSKISESEDIYTKRKKVANYLVQRGFENEIIWSVIKELELSE